MEKIIKKKQIKTKILHEIYCDDCGKYLGTSEEYEDGYYEEDGKFEMGVYIPEYCWYHINKCFCEECKEKFVSKFRNTILELGFKQD